VPSVSTPLEPGAELDAYLAQLRRRGAINSDVRASASEKLEGEDVEEEVVAEEERQRAVPVPREHQRSVRVGLVGLPNAGKSVLANALVGGKVGALFLFKPQTAPLCIAPLYTTIHALSLNEQCHSFIVNNSLNAPYRLIP
jgi:hypothetical protein